jgi:hypothetical protein
MSLSVYRNRYSHLFRDTFQEWKKPFALLLDAQRLRPRARRLRPDVKHVGALALHRDGPGKSRVRGKVQAPVRKAVGRNVQDAHHVGPRLGLREQPVENGRGGVNGKVLRFGYAHFALRLSTTEHNKGDTACGMGILPMNHGLEARAT